jgi:hypothetical protein
MMIPEDVQVSLVTADRVVARMRAGARVGREIHADEVHHLVQAYVFLLSVIEQSTAALRPES